LELEVAAYNPGFFQRLLNRLDSRIRQSAVRMQEQERLTGCNPCARIQLITSARTRAYQAAASIKANRILREVDGSIVAATVYDDEFMMATHFFHCGDCVPYYFRFV
jgi:hypothetical protein